MGLEVMYQHVHVHGVASSGIPFIPNLFKIRPVVLEFKHTDRRGLLRTCSRCAHRVLSSLSSLYSEGPGFESLDVVTEVFCSFLGARKFWNILK
jgi:hypothetical protein